MSLSFSESGILREELNISNPSVWSCLCHPGLHWNLMILDYSALDPYRYRSWVSWPALKKPTSLMTTIQPAWHAFKWHSSLELWEEKCVHPYTETPLYQQALSLRTKREKRGCGRLYMLLCFRWMWACSSKFTKHFTHRVWEGKFMSVCFDFPKMPWDCPFTTYPYLNPKELLFFFLWLFF